MLYYPLRRRRRGYKIVHFYTKIFFQELTLKKIIEKHTVPQGISRIRLSDYACEIFQTIPSRKGIKKAVKRGDVSIDGATASTGDWVKPGQIIELCDNETVKTEFYRMTIEVIYEDDYIAIVNKPAGIPVNGNRFKTVENALPLNLELSKAASRLPRPRPVHRLDSPTSGLLAIAKTGEAMISLSSQFAAKTIKKRYRAIVTGKLKGDGTIDTPVDGREAFTEFHPVKTIPSLKNGFLTLVNLIPHTGRTHQLRKHMAEIGHPIAGDKTYSPVDSLLKSKGLFLCAVELTINHPINNEIMTFSIPDPGKFSSYMERELRWWMKFNPEGQIL